MIGASPRLISSTSRHLGLRTPRPAPWPASAARRPTAARPAVLQRVQGREHLHRPVVGDASAGPVARRPERRFSSTVRSKNSERSSATWARPRRGILYGRPPHVGLTRAPTTCPRSGAAARRSSAAWSSCRHRWDRAARPPRRPRRAGEVADHRDAAVAGVQALDVDQPVVMEGRGSVGLVRSPLELWSAQRPPPRLRLTGRLAEVGLDDAGSARTSAGVPSAMMRPKSRT